MEKIFFNNWFGLLRILIVGVLAYGSLVVLLRVSGKRTLAKMNAFDLVVTVALGSTLATILLSKDIALLEGVVAFALLVGLQFVIAWLSCRSKTVESLVKSEPSLLFYHGRFLHRAMQSERVTESEVRAAIRSAGIAGLDEIAAVVLETDGTFSVVKGGKTSSSSSLQDVLNKEQK
ncbi:MAG: DUF421 domain-containing protein [Cytophagales bacterium]|nr:DUF421 domain-containing protein [Cytophagales bacterium]